MRKEPGPASRLLRSRRSAYWTLSSATDEQGRIVVGGGREGLEGAKGATQESRRQWKRGRRAVVGRCARGVQGRMARKGDAEADGR